MAITNDPCFPLFRNEPTFSRANSFFITSLVMRTLVTVHGCGYFSPPLDHLHDQLGTGFTADPLECGMRAVAGYIRNDWRVALRTLQVLFRDDDTECALSPITEFLFINGIRWWCQHQHLVEA